MRATVNFVGALLGVPAAVMPTPSRITRAPTTFGRVSDSPQSFENAIFHTRSSVKRLDSKDSGAEDSWPAYANCTAITTRMDDQGAPKSRWEDVFA